MFYINIMNEKKIMVKEKLMSYLYNSMFMNLLLAFPFILCTAEM